MTTSSTPSPGALIEAVSGQSYESYVRDHVYKPAGLLTATSDEPSRLGTANRAYPHGRISGPVRGLGDQQLLDETDQLGAASTPAGLLAMSANDLAKWLTIQLAHGKTADGGRLFSEASSATMWNSAGDRAEPAACRRASKRPRPMFKTYALGWEVSDYGGAKIISHSGGVFGFITMVVLIPEKNVGFAITMNAEESAVRRGLTYELIDHYLGRPYVDWAGALQAADHHDADQCQGRGGDQGRGAGQGRPVAVARSLRRPVQGSLVRPDYRVAGQDRASAINFNETPRMSGPLDHYQYDTFIARFEDKGIEPAYVTFGLDAEGKVDHITMKPVSPTADFSFDYQDLNFTPVASAR